MPRDLHELPKLRDSLSYLYLEHCRIEQDDKSIACFDKEGVTKVPCATLTLLMLGPGTVVTHEAIRSITDNGCLVIWCGEEGVRFYAQGMAETRKAGKVMHQARLASDEDLRLDVIRRMYEMRFEEGFLKPGLTLDELRGMEGVRVRSAYARASKQYGVEWRGRDYKRQNWWDADPINRALSAANSCLYGVCHAAIVASGYSPALGFIHVGKQLSFVYDVADLYKADISIPVAFEVVAGGTQELERRIRMKMRDGFRESNLLGRIVLDIDRCLGTASEEQEPDDFDGDAALPAPLYGESREDAAVRRGDDLDDDGHDP